MNKINSTDPDDPDDPAVFADLTGSFDHARTRQSATAPQRHVFMVFISRPNVKAAGGGDGLTVAPAPRARARDTCELPGATLSRRLKTFTIACS